MMRGVLLWLLVTASLPLQAMEWQWLEQMRQAMQQETYRGEFIIRRGDQSQAYAVAHQFLNGELTELLRPLDGEPIEILRDGQSVRCYTPSGVTLSADHAVPTAPFAQVSQIDLQRISQNYMVQHLGQERVAGYTTEVLLLRGDDWRFQQRLWLEQDSKLLLQAETLNASGQVIEQFRFTRLERVSQLPVSELTPKQPELALQQPVAAANRVSAPDASSLYGQLTWLPPGFSLRYSEHRRTVDGWREQQTYSDGLASVSVFVESMAEDVGLAASLMQSGATTVLMSYRPQAGVTVIGEIPPVTARQLAQRLSITEPAL